MKYRFAVLIFFLAFLVQSIIVGQFQIMDCSLNFILCFGVVISFIYTKSNAGILIGSGAALLFDIVLSPYMGMTSLPLAITMGICVFVREYLLNRENMMSMLFVAIGSVILYYNLYYLMTKMAGFASAYIAMLDRLPLYVILNVIAMMVIYIFMIDSATRHRDNGYLKWAR